MSEGEKEKKKNIGEIDAETWKKVKKNNKKQANSKKIEKIKY